MVGHLNNEFFLKELRDGDFVAEAKYNLKEGYRGGSRNIIRCRYCIKGASCEKGCHKFHVWAKKPFKFGGVSEDGTIQYGGNHKAPFKYEDARKIYEKVSKYKNMTQLRYHFLERNFRVMVDGSHLSLHTFDRLVYNLWRLDYMKVLDENVVVEKPKKKITVEEVFDKMKPLLDDGYSHRQSFQVATESMKHLVDQDFYKEVIAYVESKGYTKERCAENRRKRRADVVEYYWRRLNGEFF